MSTPVYYNKGDKETIEKLEYVATRLGEEGISGRCICNVVMALKYFDRTGLKEGESFFDDLEKCVDYIFRLLMSEWPKRGEDVGIAD